MSSKQNFTVVICAYTDKRWGDLCEAVASVCHQTLPALETIVVIDHNPLLFARASRDLEGCRVIVNAEAKGLSGARNSGIAAALGDIIAFLDDDAVAAPDWLEQLSAEYTDPHVIGVGGSIGPLWQSGRPRWFPTEFDWVVGCTFKGMPTEKAPVRNMIGANMSLRSMVFKSVGGFRSSIGRVMALPFGCEETELCIRARQQCKGFQILFVPSARVSHRVPANRSTWRYFCDRCYAEGLSKALVSRFVGTQDGLASERFYTLRTLPAGVLRGIRDTFLRGDFFGLARAAAISIGLSLTVAGFLSGSISGILRLSSFKG